MYIYIYIHRIILYSYDHIVWSATRHPALRSPFVPFASLKIISSSFGIAPWCPWSAWRGWGFQWGKMELYGIYIYYGIYMGYNETFTTGNSWTSLETWDFWWKVGTIRTGRSSTNMGIWQVLFETVSISGQHRIEQISTLTFFSERVQTWLVKVECNIVAG